MHNVAYDTLKQVQGLENGVLQRSFKKAIAWGQLYLTFQAMEIEDREIS